ncbi:hypothetical protein, conserved [Trypanosoma brucei gambiense DAL972]|uniref:Uncharacterized protein n=1 Tax=Trypanosoma brucei gambiense (strain MHOM/CI/86/DAL972) TaxID=679716 RepID=C9ZVR8_TRYB9|nr:hypothetical protein, conserved [Trypanosoma brucei gambiense DAL972]CBH13506.1 hypothetical protein, conserved [Trypanosoma brucei gambiense DAL972]|eukprot:XP_011775783.1 hypothetical protein, conserved [Trypanosoma brucei gambiense DAL972]
MPPRRAVMLPRQQLRTMAFSVDDQEAALAEWQSRARTDKLVFKDITLKIAHQRKSAEEVSRGGRWLAEHAALEREVVSCAFDFEKAWASCSSLLPEAAVRERAGMEERCESIHRSLKKTIGGLQKECRDLHKKEANVMPDGVNTLREKISTMREEISESIKVIEHEVESLLNEMEESENILPIETVQTLVRSSLELLDSVCESMVCKPNPRLVKTFRDAIEVGGEEAVSRLMSTERTGATVDLSSSDIRKISLVLKTYTSLSTLGSEKPDLPGDVYNRVHQSLPDMSRDKVRLAVNEVLRQKREKALARTVTLQFKKKSLELLKSFEKAAAADEEIGRLVADMEEEAKLREEQQRKKHRELDELRAVREAKELARRDEEEARRKEEEERTQRVMRAREIEFQERLKQLHLYQEQQKELQEKEIELRRALAEEEAIQKAIRGERNAKRVVERQKEYEEKCRLRKKRQQDLEEIKAARAKTLEAFFNGVRQQLGVEADPERVLQGTVSSKQNEAYVPFAEAARYTVHGYTADEVAKDPRFRLQLALLEAGLHKTAYGREVISRGYRVSAAQRPSDDNPLSNNF